VLARVSYLDSADDRVIGRINHGLRSGVCLYTSNILARLRKASR
jgi:hypothetical protein